ncbi:MAG: hypothetical protein JKX97_08075 [Candidatus Lindowbacteria bacterium]|nr:hypothetical protein [Candidatus Lindowbacteria bacterium]
MTTKKQSSKPEWKKSVVVKFKIIIPTSNMYGLGAICVRAGSTDPTSQQVVFSRDKDILDEDLSQSWLAIISRCKAFDMVEEEAVRATKEIRSWINMSLDPEKGNFHKLLISESEDDIRTFLLKICNKMFDDPDTTVELNFERMKTLKASL